MTDFYALSPSAQGERLTELARAALPLWQLDGAQLTLVKHRENAVFKVRSASDTYALRVHRAGYHTDAELLSELLWIQSINSDALRTPQVVATSDGLLFAHVSAEGVPEPRQVDLLEWFEGEPLADLDAGTQINDLDETFHAIGRLMATTHNHSEAWTLPPDFSRHAWDEDGLLGPDPFWGRYWELAALTAEQIDRLSKARDKALAELAEFGKRSDRYGLIHADFLPENLLRNGSQICLIDFDDAGFGWHLFDVATTLFFHLGEPYFDGITDALLTGYREVRALPNEHLAHLPLFLLLRGYTYLGWMHTRAETETAQTMTPMVVAAVDALAAEYLA